MDREQKIAEIQRLQKIQEINRLMAARKAPEPTSAPTAQPEQQPSVLKRTLAPLQQGLSDAMSTVAGDTYSMSGDPTQRDNLDPASRTQKALFGDIASSVGGAVSELTPEPVKRGLSNAVQWAQDNRSKHPIYGQANITGEIGDQIGKLGPEAEARAKQLMNMSVLGLPKTPRLTGGDKSRQNLVNTLENYRQKDTRRILEEDDLFSEGVENIEVSPVLKSWTKTPKETTQRMYDEVLDVDGFDPRQNNVTNIQAIDGKVTDLRNQLDNDIGKVNPIPFDEVDNIVGDLQEKLALAPELVGDSGESARRIYEMFKAKVKDLVDEDGMVDPLALLDARRALDQQLRASNKNIFDTTTLSANKIATRDLRQAINNIVSDAAPDANVMNSLRKQSDLLTASEILQEQANRQSKSGLFRKVQEVERRTGLAPPKTPAATAFNVMNAPAVAGTALAAGAVLGGRAAKNTARRLNTASRVQIQNAINATSDPVQKAALLAMLNEEEDTNATQ